MPSPRPHILLITSDQHRGDTLGCAGHPCIRTPHLDRLARMGVRFNRAYADCPICIPQRTTWMTGRTAHRNGMPSYSDDFRLPRAPELFLGSLIRSAGYTTCLVGKTHWHTEPDFDGGFEKWISFERLAGEIKARTGRPGVNHTGLGYNELYPGLNPLPPELYSTDWAVDQALHLMEDYDDSRPLFMWVSFTDPHPPFAIHEPYYSMYQGDATIPSPYHPEWMDERDLPLDLASRWLPFAPMNEREMQDARAVYYGKITNIDHQIGRLLGAFQHRGLWKDTLVIYTSDHGEMLGDFGGTAKSCFLDAAARVPLIIRPPLGYQGQIGRTEEALVGFDDLLPSLCDYAGAEIPDDVTGQSWRPLLEERRGYSRDFFHGHIDQSHLYHDGRFKYLYFCDDGSELVFDMVSEDPEGRDLSSDAKLVNSLRAKLEQHLAEEAHPHLVDGQLLNRQLPRPSDRELMARDLRDWNSIGAGIYPL